MENTSGQTATSTKVSGNSRLDMVRALITSCLLAIPTSVSTNGARLKASVFISGSTATLIQGSSRMEWRMDKATGKRMQTQVNRTSMKERTNLTWSMAMASLLGAQAAYTEANTSKTRRKGTARWLGQMAVNSEDSGTKVYNRVSESWNLLMVSRKWAFLRRTFTFHRSEILMNSITIKLKIQPLSFLKLLRRK